MQDEKVERMKKQNQYHIILPVRTTIASVLCLVYGKPVMKLMKLTEACNLVDFSHNTAT